MQIILKIKQQIQKASDKKRAETSQWFFKTGKGQYGEGDLFLGLTNPQCRSIVKRYWKETNYDDVEQLITSKFHEERLIALLILVEKYNKADKENKQAIVEFYKTNIKYINNWDLVDLSCYKILGRHLFEVTKNYDILFEFAKSDDLWERRIAIVSTMYLVRKDHFELTLKLAEELLNDKEDLMHKAIGWLLREVGKKDEGLLEDFLRSNYERIPRTTLRYAIEKFEEDKRKSYLRGDLN